MLSGEIRQTAVKPCSELQTYSHAERFLLSNETIRNIYKYGIAINCIHQAHVIKL
jgi:hypothetical protein